MPQGRSGITAGTPDRMILDAGEAYFNIDLTALEATGIAAALEGTDAVSVGATRGGSSFAINRSLREMPADGLLGPTKGMIRRQRVAPVMTLNMLEMTPENLSKIIAGLTATDTAGLEDTMQKMVGGAITADAYISNVALIATYSGSATPVLVVVTNAIVLEPPEFSMTDENEAVLSVPFTGTFDPADYTVEPWAIYHPTTIAP